MSKCGKKGVTLASLVIYIALFTGFTMFATGVSSNMNDRLFTNRSEAINYTSLNKLQYNLEVSALKSNDVVWDINATGKVISFSNGDVYEWNETSKVIYKNGGILCSNVDYMSGSLNTDINSKKITISVEFSKYLKQIKKQIVVTVEGV